MTGNYKMVTTKITILNQFTHERLTWLRSLEFFKQENAILKTRLAEILDSTTDKNFLQLAEQYLNQFILKDECIVELKRDINLLDKEDKMDADKTPLKSDKQKLKKQNQLRNEIILFEKGFNQLKNEFNQQLLSI